MTAPIKAALPRMMAGPLVRGKGGWKSPRGGFIYDGTAKNLVRLGLAVRAENIVAPAHPLIRITGRAGSWRGRFCARDRRASARGARQSRRCGRWRQSFLRLMPMISRTLRTCTETTKQTARITQISDEYRGN